MILSQTDREQESYQLYRVVAVDVLLEDFLQRPLMESAAKGKGRLSSAGSCLAQMEDSIADFSE